MRDGAKVGEQWLDDYDHFGGDYRSLHVEHHKKQKDKKHEKAKKSLFRNSETVCGEL